MSGSDSRVFYTQTLIAKQVQLENDEDSNKIEHPFFNKLASQKSEEIPNTQTTRGKQVVPKNMVRTDSRQQKLDMFINVSKSNKDETGMDQTNKISGKVMLLVFKYILTYLSIVTAH